MNCPFKASVGEDAQTHLSSKDPTNSDDAEDIKDGRADDRSDSNITVSDEDTWKQTQWAKVLHEKNGNNDCVTVPITEAKSSGAELPAAMNVAPATSSLRFSFCTTQQQQTIHIQQSLWHKHRPNLEQYVLWASESLKVGQRKNSADSAALTVPRYYSDQLSIHFWTILPHRFSQETSRSSRRTRSPGPGTCRGPVRRPQKTVETSIPNSLISPKYQWGTLGRTWRLLIKSPASPMKKTPSKDLKGVSNWAQSCQYSLRSKVRDFNMNPKIPHQILLDQMIKVIISTFIFSSVLLGPK